MKRVGLLQRSGQRRVRVMIMDASSLLKLLLLQTLPASTINIQPSLLNSFNFQHEPANNSMSLHRALSESGFHRTLLAELSIPDEMAEELSDASFIIVQNITSSLYVDIDQLSSLHSMAGEPQVIVTRHMDTEKPASLSTSHVLLAYSKLKGNRLSVSVPIHFRYQPPCDSQYVPVTIPPPLLFYKPHNSSKQEISDTVKLLPCNSTSSERCHWHQMPYTLDQDSSNQYCFEEDCARYSDLLIALIPCGAQNSVSLVVGITVLVTLLAALYICIAIGSVQPQTIASRR